ncbi:hypothetical protein EYF80_039833 [Liparis tanakae]|uniref:Uncharacterized protein n=1 Tax=Liparis tanakae TaxID=230148 RepID=A0A4Z2GA66_9TELE|nr:hypothetical protein EYF80_039833 [Liparis tanakae]
MEDSCPPQAWSSVTAVYTGTVGPQNRRICPRTETLYWQLGAVWSWRSTAEALSGRLVWSIPEISVTDGTLADGSHGVTTETGETGLKEQEMSEPNRPGCGQRVLSKPRHVDPVDAGQPICRQTCNARRRERYLVEVLQLDDVQESRGVDRNIAGSQTWKTNGH